jgi:hypothetical protein
MGGGARPLRASGGAWWDLVAARRQEIDRFLVVGYIKVLFLGWPPREVAPQIKTGPQRPKRGRGGAAAIRPPLPGVLRGGVLAVFARPLSGAARMVGTYTMHANRLFVIPAPI